MGIIVFPRHVVVRRKCAAREGGRRWFGKKAASGCDTPRGEKDEERRVGERETAAGGLSEGLRGSRTKVEKLDSARGTHPADTAADTSGNRRSVASVGERTELLAR